MRRLLAICCLLFLLCGCVNSKPKAQIVTTTLPVYEFTVTLCAGTDISVSRLITGDVSCLHDYSVQASQMQAIEDASVVIISGGGLEDFIYDLLPQKKTVIDASKDIALNCGESHHHDEHHHHESDPHYWLSPELALSMVHNICNELTVQYPQYTDIFSENCAVLEQKLSELKVYGEKTLQTLSSRKLITFHDGFSYFAEAFDLKILKAIEEESGSEASAAELIEIIKLVDENNLPAIFTEDNGSTSAAGIIAKETGANVYDLTMAMSGESYFDAMYRNINTVKEALG